MSDAVNNSSGLSEAATSAVGINMQKAKELADSIGQRAAIDLANRVNKGDVPEFLQMSSPGIPAPSVMPSAMPKPQTPIWNTEEGGGYTNYGQRVSHDKSELFNNIGAAVQQAGARHKEDEIVKAQRDYEVLFGAMDALRRSNPNDPKQQADIQHNQNILEQFFSDKQKVKRLEKILGYDAFDPKKEAKKQADPHYQAMSKAVQTVQKVPLSGTSGITAQAGTLQSQMAQASQASESPSQTGSEPAWMANLPENAKAFARHLPSNPPDPLAPLRLQAELVKQGLQPSADKILDVNKAILEGKVSLQKTILDSATTIEKAKWDSDASKYKSNLDAASAERVALLNLQGKRLEAEMASYRLSMEKDTLDMKGYENLLEGTKQQYLMAKEKYDSLTKAGENADPRSWRGLTDDVSAAKREMIDAQKGYNQAQTNLTGYLKKRGFSTKGLGDEFTPTKIKDDSDADAVIKNSGKQLVPGSTSFNNR